jgi:hypothetical protein
MSIWSTASFHRRAKGAKEAAKRQPTVRLPDRLLAHMERWQRLDLMPLWVNLEANVPEGKIRRTEIAARAAIPILSGSM